MSSYRAFMLYFRRRRQVATGGDPSPVINWDFLQSQSLTSFSRTSNATLFDSTGKLTYAANNLLLNSATLSTQTVTVVSGVNYIVSFYGTGSITLSGAASATINGTGAGTRVYQAITASTASLTLTVSGSVTSAQLEAVTYQTTPSTYNPTTTAAYYGPRYPYAYNGATWDAQGLLVEAAGTNLIKQSGVISTPSPWGSAGLTSNGTSGTSPDGSQAWNVLTEDTANNSHGVYITSSVTVSSGATVTLSYYLKAGTRRYVLLEINGDAINYAGVVVDTVNWTAQTYAAGTGSASSYTLTYIGGGVYRVSVTGAVAGYTTYVPAWGGTTSSTGAGGWNAVYVGTSSTMYGWGFQAEANDQATSYIPTTSASVTRNADTSLAFSAISLPTGLSFSRASNAMQYDAAGRLTYAPNNLFLYSNTFSNGAWTKWATGSGVTPTVTGGQADPLGGTNGWRLQCSGVSASPDRSAIYQAATNSASANIVTIWAKSNTGASQTVAFLDYGGISGGAITVTTSWQQFSISATGANSGIIFGSLFNVSGTGGTIDVLIYAPTASLVTYETVPRPCDQVITTSSAYYGPRYDYDPLTRLPKGLLVEEARTNLSVQSGSLTNAAWAAYQSDTGTDATTTPSGTTAVKLTAQAGTGYKPQLYNTTTIAFSASTNYSFSCYVKAGTHNFVAIGFQSAPCFVVAVFDLGNTSNTTRTQLLSNSGTSVSTTQTYVGNGWYRIASVASLSSGTGAAYTTLQLAQAATGNSQDGYGNLTWNPAGTESAYFAFPQFEAGSFPTSYIPTTSASVQRTADIATLTGTALTTLQGSAGTVVTEFNCSVFPGGYFQLVAIGTAGYAFSYVSAARKGASNPSSTLDIVTANTATAGVDNRVGVSFLSSGAASVSLNGGSAVAGTGASFSPTTVYLGSQSSSNFLDGYIRKLAIWNVKLSDAKLVQKSTVGANF